MTWWGSCAGAWVARMYRCLLEDGRCRMRAGIGGRVNSGKGDGMFDAGSLRAFCEEVFLSCGMAQEDAAIVADSLVQANLRGVDCHGVARVGIYAQRRERGAGDQRP